MALVGVICEYNPFHNGHAKQLRMIRERCGSETAIICLMSGNYVQRGAPALFDKSLRAHAALLGGADLVLELPLTYSLRSAEGFADGGVEILSPLGCDALCFGAEHGDPEAFLRTAGALLQPEFQTALREELQLGDSFAAARARALARDCDASLLEEPNDILGVEYCKALLRRQSNMQPLVLKREGAYHAERFDAENPSAGLLRERILQGGEWRTGVPEKAAAFYETAATHTLAAGERALLARLRTLTENEFAALPFGAEGLWRKLLYACRSEQSVEAILNAVKSKRYAMTRVRRMLMCAFLGLTEAVLNAPAPYVRVLGFRERGRALLRKARADGLQLLNSGESFPDPAFSELERRAGDLYPLFALQPPFFCGAERARRNLCVTED